MESAPAKGTQTAASCFDAGSACSRGRFRGGYIGSQIFGTIVIRCFRNPDDFYSLEVVGVLCFLNSFYKTEQNVSKTLKMYNIYVTLYSVEMDSMEFCMGGIGCLRM